jgi:REP-associated tyrosine transposase
MPRPHPERRSPRLRGYDYSQSGAYFVTICTYKRAHWFGRITDAAMVLNTIGQTAAACWDALPEHFAEVELDVYVIMPNHVHGIIILPGGGAALGTIIGTYKAAVTRHIHREQRAPPEHLWQERYHDQIIRNERALGQIREYIEYNPIRWHEDALNT